MEKIKLVKWSVCSTFPYVCQETNTEKFIFLPRDSNFYVSNTRLRAIMLTYETRRIITGKRLIIIQNL